jgi:glycosyltransferase involved in cell wall biosynthesis
LRVVLDGQPLLEPRAGIGHYTYQLLRALARADPSSDFVLFCVRRLRSLRAPQLPDFPEANVHVKGHGLWQTIDAKLRRRLGFEATVESFVGRFDIFHATNYVFNHRVHAALRVASIYDLTLLLFPEMHPAERVRQIARDLQTVGRDADHLVTTSMSSKSDIVKHLSVPPERITVVPGAADETFRPVERGEVEAALHPLGLAYGGYLLFVGTVEPRKNLERLLTALESIEGKVGTLVMAGPHGWGAHEVWTRIAHLQRRGLVRHLGYIRDALRPVLMNGARAFVYPSLYEGFGLPPLEAMACGTPVMSSNVSSLPEVIGDAGLLVDPLDVGGLAQSIRRLWEDDGLRAELRQRGLQRARRFSWQRTATLMLAVYAALRTERRAPVQS